MLGEVAIARRDDPNPSNMLLTAEPHKVASWKAPARVSYSTCDGEAFRVGVFAPFNECFPEQDGVRASYPLTITPGTQLSI